MGKLSDWYNKLLDRIVHNNVTTDIISDSASDRTTSRTGNSNLSSRDGQGVTNSDSFLSNYLPDASVWDMLKSYLYANTGANLTNAQQQMNAFNAQQSQLQRDYETQMSNTAYQRQVADMQAAGLNPAIAYGSSSGATTPSGSAASGSNVSVGSGLNGLLSAAISLGQLNIQKMMAKANVANIEANTKKTEAETKGIPTQIELTAVNVEKVQNELRLISEQAKTEISKQYLNSASANLANVNAENIEKIQASVIALHEAHTEEATSRAALNFVQTSYQQGLIDKGYITAMISDIRASASSKEAQAALNEWENSLNTGTLFKPDENDGIVRSMTKKVANDLVGTARTIRKVLSR